MVFGTKLQTASCRDITISHDAVTLDMVDNYKYLGTVLDPQLSPSSHVQYLKSKTYSKIKLLGTLRNITDMDTWLTMYKTLVLPIYDYCDFLLLNISNQDAQALQKLQNCAFRNILRVDTNSTNT